MNVGEAIIKLRSMPVTAELIFAEFHEITKFEDGTSVPIYRTKAISNENLRCVFLNESEMALLKCGFMSFEDEEIDDN